jgi:DNA-binding NarL/FixJ family response regulator
MKDPNNQKPGKTGIFLVDDHPMVREQLTEMINRDDDLFVCGEAEDARTALEGIGRVKPDLAIVDLTLRNAHGIELIKDLRVRGDKVAILVLSMHDESVYAERVLRAGARGYITKQEPSRKVIEAIRAVLSGKIYVSEKIAGQLMQKLTGADTENVASRMDRLTDRDLEIYQLIGQGLTTHEIAAALNLDIKSIETYRFRIREKLEIKSTSDLYEHAMRWVMHERGKK